MKWSAVALVALLLGQVSAQTLVQKLFVMRSDTTTVDPYSGMTRVCVVVFPDGRYRMERSYQGLSGGAPQTNVYVDTLKPDELNNLHVVLDNQDLEQIKTPQARGGIIENMDTLSLIIPREHNLQNIEFATAAERKPYEKALKPFLNSLKAIEKRKVRAAKNEQPNNCQAPRVLYRTMLPPGSSPTEDQSQP
ncbi:MAG TPA: hypothetical protein VMU61_17790 [Candidatus Aquilonibacter sp.]|nr:hypothetical protein [Candidatus Aquilonibacter sp.]